MERLSATTASTTTPTSSPGLFSPATAALKMANTKVDDGTPLSSPFLHPLSLQMHKVKETHDARVERDFITGRKCINQYEIIDEIGRGVHGKVKLARSFETGEFVAIKIIQRFSKKRRLGRVVASPEQKIKREIAILKKVRHPNVVGLLEVIDDPELKKIYMVLEHVDLGEIVWRKKGDRSICLYERRRIEREMRGEIDNGEAEMDYKMNERRRLRKMETIRAKASKIGANYWSLEHGNDEDYDMAPLSRQNTHESNPYLSQSYASTTGSRSVHGRSNPSSNAPSRAPSRTQSRAQTPQPRESFEIGPPEDDDEDGYDETPIQVSSQPSLCGSTAALEGTMYGSYVEEAPYLGRSPSMPDSIISHMTSHDDFTMFQHDSYAEDYAYVPCFTIEQARTTFRDTVLGLEYLHYEGIVHRDIKPANLLWNKDHRVKISDFGVSYFGRPIRDGEPEENISEADAQDFDDDLELAKTVGTPAFFAPELCHTEVGVQHKVNEQIDVWSLGVTLYCLIFARIPFLAEDEFKLFKAIATMPVYIPKRRLKAVDPSTADSSNPQKRQTPVQEPYRDESMLVYEDIDDDLYDLLYRMLLKDPTERIKLREVKRHPWVLKGIPNVKGWLDDTDPSRKTEGRRIQVDEKELEHAVVPITLLERARSNVKKVLGKVIGTISEGRGSRGRALSTAASSAGDSHNAMPTTPSKDTRRGSLKGDESFFASAHTIQTGAEHFPHHPLAQSVISSPIAPKDEEAFLYEEKPHSVSAGGTPRRQQSYNSSENDFERPRPPLPERSSSNAASIQTVINRGHSHSRSLTEPASPGILADTETQAYENSPERERYASRRRSSQRLRHSRSGELSFGMPEMYGSGKHADRTLFTSDNKHGEASIGISNAVAPGAFDAIQSSAFEHARALKHTRSSDISSTPAISPISLASPGFFEQSAFSRHHQYFSKPFFLQSSSAPNVAMARNARQRAAFDEQISPETEIETESSALDARLYGFGMQESSASAHGHNFRKQHFEVETTYPKRDVFATVTEESLFTRPNSAGSSGPTSSEVDIFARKEEQEKRTQSVSSVASSAVTSPPSVVSPISSQEPAFRSDPSLPALVSGASSISGDPEDEFLKHPGVVNRVESIFDVSEGTDAETPPAVSILGKDALASPEDDVDDVPKPISMGDVPIVGSDDEAGYNGDGDLSALTADEDEDEDSDSDEGLTMDMGRKRAKKAGSIVPSSGTLSTGGATGTGTRRLRRRGTNASSASTDTAKKVAMSE